MIDRSGVVAVAVDALASKEKGPRRIRQLPRIWPRRRTTLKGRDLENLLLLQPSLAHMGLNACNLMGWDYDIAYF